jgi:peroxiredoxin Q/BCP
MFKALTVFTALGLALAGQQGAPAPAPEGLNVGDPAPPFSLPGSDGKTHSLADHKGKVVVVAWFPAAFTGG